MSASPVLHCNQASLCALPAPRKCPECRIPLGNARNLALEKIAAAIELPCTLQDRGCKVSCKYADIGQHVKTCDYRDMKCPEPGCNWRGAPTALASHFEDTQGYHRIMIDTPRCVNGKWSSSLTCRKVIESGELDKDANWTRAYQADGHVFIRLVHTHRDGTLTIHVVFAGPESMRAKYKCTVCISNDEYRSTLEGAPLYAHQDTSKATIHGALGLVLSEPMIRTFATIEEGDDLGIRSTMCIEKVSA